MENVTNSGNIVCGTLGTSEDKTFTVLIVHDLLEMLDEPIEEKDINIELINFVIMQSNLTYHAYRNRS